jgi:hypothetical protein
MPKVRIDELTLTDAIAFPGDKKPTVIRTIEHRACSRYKTHINDNICVDSALPVEVF